MMDAARSYMRNVLHRLPDEADRPGLDGDAWRPLANPFDPSQGFADEDYEKPYDPWEDDTDEAPTTTSRPRRQASSTSPPCGP